MKRGGQVSDFRGFGLNVRTVVSVIVLAAAVCVPVYAADTGDGWQTVRMRVTAYCPCPKCCGEYADGITANGHRIRPGDTFAAADRRYSFGTEMLIPGYNKSVPVEVLDRGGAIKGNRVDVFFATHEEALQWGVRYLDVEIRRK